jgi:tetratricopeptide (TPR) repeat protein
VIRFDDLAAAALRGENEFVLQHADTVLIEGDCPPKKIGWVFYFKCDAALGAANPILAIAAGEQAVSWAIAHKDADLEGRVRICLAYAMLQLGRVAEVVALLEGYLKGLKKNPAWREFEDLARYNLAVAYRHSGRLRDAVDQYRCALLLPESRSESHVQFRQNLAWALMLLGEAEAAREQLDMVAEHVREGLSLGRLTSLWVDRAALCLVEGDTAGAKKACRQVLDALDERARAVHLATTYVTLGRIALVEGAPEEAKRYSMLARTHAETAERWDLHNEGTRLFVSASEKGGKKLDTETLAGAVRLLVVGRGDP